MSKKLYEESSIQSIANAIRAKNGSATGYTVSQMASAISVIETGADTSGDTVAADKMLAGITAHDSEGEPITGTIPSEPAKTVTPSTSAQIAVAAGKYTTGDITVAAANPSAQIVVTAPTGSTVTATKGTTTLTATEVSGTWTFALPEFGTWTVTATKGADSASDTITVEQDSEVSLSYRPTVSTTATSGVTYTNGISTLTPADLSLYAEAISRNSEITKSTSNVYVDYRANHYRLSVGDNIYITVSEASYEFVILGFNHDDLTSATAYGTATATGKAGITLQVRNCISGLSMNGDQWQRSYLRTTLQSTIKNTMSGDWTTIIKTVNKNNSGTISTDTLFLLSTGEIDSGTETYAWYLAGNSKIKLSIYGNNTTWWTRSPYTTRSYFYAVNDSGYMTHINQSGIYSVSFAFCI